MNTVKLWCVFIILLASPSWGQTYSEKELQGIFKEIIKTDQSNLKQPVKRAAIFVANFECIQSILETGHSLHPEASYSKRTHKLIVKGLRATFIHILQSDPTQLLNEEKIDFYRSCLSTGLLSTSSLKYGLRIFQIDRDLKRSQPWSEELKKMYERAKYEWQIEI